VFRRSRLNTDIVIDSNDLEHAFREKPISTFSRHALPVYIGDGDD